MKKHDAVYDTHGFSTKLALRLVRCDRNLHPVASETTVRMFPLIWVYDKGIIKLLENIYFQTNNYRK